MEKLNKTHIILNAECKNKREVFEMLSEIASDCTNKTNIVDLFEEREEQISTGLQDGFAIPHAKGDKIKKGSMFYIRLKNPIKDWETFDNQPVSHIISFVIPSNAVADEHVKNLAKVAQAIQREGFKNKLASAKNELEIIKIIDEVIISDEVQTNNSNVKKNEIIAGITACAAGLAHTYMAKEAMENACKELGYGYKVEAHGSLGIENQLTSGEYKKAFMLIIAADVAVDLNGKYKNHFVYRCTTNEMIKNGKEVVQRAVENFKKQKGNVINQNQDFFDLKPQYDEIRTNNKYGRYALMFGRGILKHMMTGIGYCVPLLIGCGLMIGISQLIAQFTVEGGGSALGGLYKFSWDDPSSFVTDVKSFNGFLYTMQIMGMNVGLQVLFPMFLAGFIGYSMNGKAGLPAGFVCGAFAILRNTGFVGAVLSSLSTGVIIQLIIKYLTPKGKAKVLGSVLFVPMLGSLSAIILTWWVWGYPLMKFNQAMQEMVTTVSQNNGSKTGLAALIATMMAFDLGGPVNKAAWAAYTVIWSDTSLPDVTRYSPNAAGNIAIGIPVLGVGLSVFIGNKYFNEQEKVQGTTCLVMGLLGISEGAIPFFLRKPLRYWIVNISGAVLGACFYVGMNGYLKVGAGVIYGWAFASKPVLYILAFVIGCTWIAILNSQWEKISWHKRNNIRYQIFIGTANFKNIAIFTRNIFTSDKKAYVETKFDKVVASKEIV